MLVGHNLGTSQLDFEMTLTPGQGH